MNKIFACIALTILFWTACVQADELENALQQHGSWYSCIYMNSKDCSARMGTKRSSLDASLIIDFYKGGKDPVGIRLYSPLDFNAPPMDGRTNHGSIDIDGKQFCRASFAVYPVGASECAYVYPDKDLISAAAVAKQCTIHIINEFGVKRSFTFLLDGFADAKSRTEYLHKQMLR